MNRLTASERFLINALNSVSQEDKERRVVEFLNETVRVDLDKNFNGKTIAEKIIELNSKKVMQALEEYASRTERTINKKGLLIHSISFDCRNSFNYMVDSGIYCINEKGMHGITPLHVAARGWDSTYLEKLIELNAEYTQDESGEYPHEVAERHGRDDYKEILLDYSNNQASNPEVAL